MEGYVNPNAQQQQQQQQFGLDPNASYGGGQLAVQPSQPGGQQQQPPPYDIEAAVLGRALMADFLRASRTYDILPESSKVVVFDVAVPVKLAFYALVEHGACPVPSNFRVEHNSRLIFLYAVATPNELMMLFSNSPPSASIIFHQSFTPCSFFLCDTTLQTPCAPRCGTRGGADTRAC